MGKEWLSFDKGKTVLVLHICTIAPSPQTQSNRSNLRRTGPLQLWINANLLS